VRATLEQRALEGFRSLGLSFEVVSEHTDPPSFSERNSPPTPAAIQAAINLVSAGDYKAALPVLERAAFTLRSNSMLFYLKSLAEANLGSMQMALRSCMSAVEHDPKNEGARALLQALTSAAQSRDPGNG
jgi:tetratricopeptide (TPR) repeat protein